MAENNDNIDTSDKIDRINQILGIKIISTSTF